MGGPPRGFSHAAAARASGGPALGLRGWLVLVGQVRLALPPSEKRAVARSWRNGLRVALSAVRRTRAPDRAGRVDGALVLLEAWDADRAVQEVGPLAARLSGDRRTVMAAGPVLVRVAVPCGCLSADLLTYAHVSRNGRALRTAR